jgi:hypothetical protein
MAFCHLEIRALSKSAAVHFERISTTPTSPLTLAYCGAERTGCSKRGVSQCCADLES